MAITSLGYIGINSSRRPEWEGFATNLLGMQKVDQGGRMSLFRMDDRKQRLIITGEGEENLAFMGWEVSSSAALDGLASKLDKAGVPVTEHSASRADERHVARLVSFADPDGNRIEAFCGPEIASDPFLSGRPISGFKTGSLGMGHVVMHVAKVDGLLHFYRDLLGFSVTDYGLTPYPLYFFHVNGRHHSFAMVGSGRKGIHHFMVELLSLDDVGQGYDIAQQRREGIAYSLGRHSNDHMLSFYSNTPSNFFVEYGWGAQIVDPATWEPYETKEGPSTWGHERLHLPEDDAVRLRMRAMRHQTARDGFRAPDPTPNCAWLDAAIRAE